MAPNSHNCECVISITPGCNDSTLLDHLKENPSSNLRRRYLDGFSSLHSSHVRFSIARRQGKYAKAEGMSTKGRSRQYN